MQQIRCILSDFDGVVCKDYFYNQLQKYDSIMFEKINKEIFKGERELIRSWMRGEVTYKDINTIITERYGIDADVFQEIHEKSMLTMQLNMPLLNYYNELRQQGIRVGLLTDNMDSFSLFFVDQRRLLDYFDAIFSSSDYGVLKGEDNGKLMGIALQKLGVSAKETIVIDDREKMKEISESKGGKIFLYNWRDADNIDNLKNHINSLI